VIISYVIDLLFCKFVKRLASGCETISYGPIRVQLKHSETILNGSAFVLFLVDEILYLMF